MIRQLGISTRSVAIVAGLLGMVSLAIGAHAALNKRALDAAKAIGTEQAEDANKPARLALVIGNGHYPDAAAPAGAADQRRPRADRNAAPQRL